jgi:protein-tyrosine phosphatase
LCPETNVPHYIDLHTHVLPGLDDGSPDLETSIEMLQLLASLGFEEVCATPHQRNGLYIPEAAEIAAALELTRTACAYVLPNLRLRLGAENYWDDVFTDRLRRDALPCYDTQRAFLFEVNPVTLPPRLDEALFEIRLSTRLPVMAHPERYLPIQRDFHLAEALAKQAALVVDLEAVGGNGGRAEVKTARKLLEEGIAHAVASDIHHPDAGKELREGLGWIRKHLGENALTRLLEEHPRRILAGELPS